MKFLYFYWTGDKPNHFYQELKMPTYNRKHCGRYGIRVQLNHLIEFRFKIYLKSDFSEFHTEPPSPVFHTLPKSYVDLDHISNWINQCIKKWNRRIYTKGQKKYERNKKEKEKKELKKENNAQMFSFLYFDLSAISFASELIYAS